MFTGIAASSGIAIGKAVLITQDEIRVHRRNVTNTEHEWQRFLEAVKIFGYELGEASRTVGANAGPAEADILTAQTEILHDPDLHDEIRAVLESNPLNVEYACCTVLSKYIVLFDALPDEMMSSRADDFKDIRHRLLRILTGVAAPDLHNLPEGCIVAGNDILPSSAAMLDPRKVSGIVSGSGTKFSHTSIIARALGIPAVVSLGTASLRIKRGDLVVVDGDIGAVDVNPSSGQLSLYQPRVKSFPYIKAVV